MNLRELTRVVKGNLLSGDPDSEIEPSKISTDSRTIRRGQFFIALKGPSFDGNAFVGEVFKKGAIGALVTQYRSSDRPCSKIVLEVKDTTRSLQDIAHHHRMKFDIPVIGVTGSNGKTTVKDMIWTILSRQYKVLRNEGTKNNHIGVPQTLLKIDKGYDACVLEMGTNHRGEIRRLGDIARPEIAVITNIGPSHLEFLGDLNGVYEAKREIFDFLDRRRGIAVINGDDEFLARIKAGPFRLIRYGLKEGNHFRAGSVSQTKSGIAFSLNAKERFRLNILGIHNVYNALAAIAVASKFNISYRVIKSALCQYKANSMRLDPARVRGIDIINDSYNSNPLSMERALDVIKYYPANARWVVSGDMLELGKDGIRFHKMIGRLIAGSNILGLLTLGKLSEHTMSQARKSGLDRRNSWHCQTHDEAARILRRVARKGDVILIKGSRGMRMEEVINRFKNNK